MSSEAGAAERVALVAAMRSEIRHAVEALTGPEETRVGPWHAWRGTIGEHDVVALETGIGMVNAASALATLLARERPLAVLNFGCAGAHRDDMHPGDVVVATEVVAYGSVTVLPDGSEQYDGFRYDVEGTLYMHPSIAVDSGLLGAARAAAGAWSPVPWPGASSDQRPSVVFGTVGSADCWTQHPPRIASLHQRHGSLCEEMEAAALAQVAAIYRVPFLAVKDISNNELLAPTMLAPGGPSLFDVRAEVGARSFALVERLIRSGAVAPAARS